MQGNRVALRVEIEQNASSGAAPVISDEVNSLPPSPKPISAGRQKGASPTREAHEAGKTDRIEHGQCDRRHCRANQQHSTRSHHPSRSIPSGIPKRFRPSSHSFANRLCRALWGVAWLCLFRPSPKPLHRWRRSLLRLFGARIGEGVVVHPSARIWGPWNLEMAAHSCLSPHVDCYSVNTVRIGAYATVSQYSFLCTATHNADLPEMPLVTAPITIGDHAWVAADVFVGPNVTIGEGAVVGARSTVIRDVKPWTVVAGHPVRTLRKRPRTAAAGRIKASRHEYFRPDPHTQ